MNLPRKIGFFSAFILPALVVVGCYMGGWYNWSSVLFVFVLMPLIDHFAGIDKENVPKDQQGSVGQEFYYRFVTYVWVYVQFAFFLWGISVVSSGRLNDLPEWTGFTIGFALVTGGIGITVAHELGHKKSALERFYSKALLMTVCYMHFYIEHNRGHHVNVATPLDPATAKKKQNFYAFWLQSVLGSFRHAWELEKNSLKLKGKSLWSLHNQMIWFVLLPILFCVALMFAFNNFTWMIPLFFVVQSVLAFSLLELVNYVEHYGILRRETSPGQYERVNPLHSWNASHLISNFFLFQLQRHSDHHYNAIKRYQVLDHYDQSPQLPFGYPTMILVAMVPPLWFRMMDPRLDTWASQAADSDSYAFKS